MDAVGDGRVTRVAGLRGSGARKEVRWAGVIGFGVGAG
jgi:hypothetical protein